MTHLERPDGLIQRLGGRKMTGLWAALAFVLLLLGANRLVLPDDLVRAQLVVEVLLGFLTWVIACFVAGNVAEGIAGGPDEDGWLSTWRPIRLLGGRKAAALWSALLVALVVLVGNRWLLPADKARAAMILERTFDFLRWPFGLVFGANAVGYAQKALSRLPTWLRAAGVREPPKAYPPIRPQPPKPPWGEGNPS